MATLFTRRPGTEGTLSRLTIAKRLWCSTDARGVMINTGHSHQDQARAYALHVPFEELEELAEYLLAYHKLHQRSLATVTNSTPKP